MKTHILKATEEILTDCILLGRNNSLITSLLIIPVENWHAVNRTGDKDVSRTLAANYFHKISIVGVLQGCKYACG